MAASSRTSLSLILNRQTVGYQPTADETKQQTYAVASVTGAKRNFDTFRSGQAHLPVQQVRANIASAILAEASSHRLQASKINLVESESCSTNGSTQKISLTPTAKEQPRLSLRHNDYGLPDSLVQNFESLGVHSIYPWQSKCLLESGALTKSRNLVYTAPTGAGKSLVADIVLLRRIIEEPSKKALLVLPYVALVQEKTRWLRRLLDGVSKIGCDQITSSFKPRSGHMDVKVAAVFGSSRAKLVWSDFDVAVCTIEKANSLINTAIEEATIDDLGIIVLDELHMLDDQHRGYIMELMATKLMALKTKMQIIGMSATLSNPELLAQWLNAKFFVASYRPIPIKEFLVYDNDIYATSSSKEFLRMANQLSSPDPTQKASHPVYKIDKSDFKELSNAVTNAVVALTVETTRTGLGALVFSGSRQSVQNLAILISQAMPLDMTCAETTGRRNDVLASLQTLPGGFEPTFLKTVPHGVGIHHAGLTTEERDIIIEAYDQGVVKVMVATCSLAAGINLPARRVILHGARMGRDLVGPAMLRQMRGRAGRKGKDEIGETYLCCQKSDLESVAELLEAELPPIASCLGLAQRGFQRAILEIIATQLANSYDSLRSYTMQSLLWHTAPHTEVLAALDQALAWLTNNQLIEKLMDNVYGSTPFGRAVVASGLTPEDGQFVHSDLRRALSSFVMDSELHLLYLFTPIPQHSPSAPLTSEVSFPIFRDLIESLDEPSLRALQLIGVDPGHIHYLANSGVENLSETSTAEVKTARICRRVYSTFALRDLCNEVPIHRISLKYNLPRGAIQNLAQTCHGFAAGMIKFCQRMAEPISRTAPSSVAGLLPSTYARAPSLESTVSDPQANGFSMLAAVLEHMQSRLYAGARADLLDMTRVAFVKGRMARLLYESGFKSVRALAEADAKKDILPVMWSAFGWKLRTNLDRGNHGDETGQTKETVQELYDERRQKLEEKLLQKAEVMVASAVRVHEQEVVNIAAELEE